MDLAAFTDCPAVPRFPQWVRLDLEREGVNLDHDTNMMAQGLERQSNIRPSPSNWPTTSVRFDLR
jgi:hypothetical protein